MEKMRGIEFVKSNNGVIYKLLQLLIFILTIGFFFGDRCLIPACN